jgi:hypothetical protein
LDALSSPSSIEHQKKGRVLLLISRELALRRAYNILR